MKIELDGWTIGIYTDCDEHITISLENGDASKVMEVDEDLFNNDTEWVGRFTTEKIEEEYKQYLELEMEDLPF